MTRLRISVLTAIVAAMLIASPVSAWALGRGVSSRVISEPITGGASTQTVRGASVPGVFLVKVRPSGKGTVATLDALPGVSAADVRVSRDRSAMVKTPSGKSDKQFLQELNSSPSIEFAEPNYIRQVSAYAVPPNDPGYTSTQMFSWGGPWVVGAKSWWMRDANANSGMDIASLWSSLEASSFPARASGSAIKVAVIDTGFYMDHPDKGANILAGKDEFSTYSGVTDVLTKDLDVSPVDPSAPLNSITTASHGTCVAGQIGAGTNNGIGVAGVTYDSTVLVYKVQGVWIDGDPPMYPAGCAVIFDTAIIDAINDATADGAKVINMSLGGSNYSQSIQDAIDHAWSHGVLVVAASGNSGALNGVQYPGANAHVIGVGSYTVTGTAGPTLKARSYFTDYGIGRDPVGAGANNGRLDILAPGQGIWGLTQPGYDRDGAGVVYEPGYSWWDGTSMASPAFAGMAAMLWRFAPALTPDELASVFYGSAVDAGSDLGYGYVNPNAAYSKLQEDYPYLLAPTMLSMYSSTDATSVSLSWSPVAGRSVSYDISDNGVLLRNVTDSSTILTLGEGSHVIVVTPRSDYNWWSPATNIGGTVVVERVPVLPGAMSGTVTSGDSGLVGVMVSIPGTGTSTTAANGTYTIAGITPGNYTATFSKTGYTTETTSVVITTDAMKTQNMSMSLLPGTLSGTVTSGGSNLAGVTVSIPGTGTATTAANGTYAIAGITPGTYTATYSKAGYTTETTSVVIATNATTSKNMVLIDIAPPTTTAPGALKSYVPASGATISLVATDGVGNSGVASTYWRILNPSVEILHGTGTSVPVPSSIGTYALEYRSTDTAGNTETTQTTSFTVTAAPLLPVFRFRNLISGYYLWSADPTERATINSTLSSTWTEEGEAYSINPATNTATLMRFRNISGGFYLYSADPNEWADINAKLSASWVQEGPAYSISRSHTAGAKTVWRFRNRSNGTYLYSADPVERADINARLGASWQEEGEAYYLSP